MDQPAKLGAVLLCGLVSLVGGVLVARAQYSPKDYDLVKQWEVPLTSYLAFFSIGFALCPDGSAYARVDEQGGMERVTREGVAAGTVGTIEWKGARLACDGERRLYVAGRKKLSIYQPDAEGNLSRVSEAQTTFEIGRILVAPEASLYDLAPDGSAYRHLSPEGKILHSFAIEPRPGLVLSSFPSLSWDAHCQRVLVTFQGSLNVESVDSAGHRLSVQLPPMAGIRPAVLIAPVLFSFPQGRYVAEVFGRSEIAQAFDITGLQLLDGSFHLLWSHNLDKTKGVLLGISEDGGLYFLQGIGSKNYKLVRYALNARGPASQN